MKDGASSRSLEEKQEEYLEVEMIEPALVLEARGAGGQDSYIDAAAAPVCLIRSSQLRLTFPLCPSLVSSHSTPWWIAALLLVP